MDFSLKYLLGKSEQSCCYLKFVSGLAYTYVNIICACTRKIGARTIKILFRENIYFEKTMRNYLILRLCFKKKSMISIFTIF